MSKYDKKYDAFHLFMEILGLGESSERKGSGEKAREASGKEDVFYEIEYDSSPFPGVGKYVMKSQKIEEPQRDEIRDLFSRMREIARKNRSYSYQNSRFHDNRVRLEDSKIFYEQGMFMKDFEDTYEPVVPYSSYFPYYQMMGYEQLRTYFTWRTKVRKGVVEATSLSYAFLYIYELLGNIGVNSPKEGLDKLLFFWKEYRSYEKNLDKYVPRWLKDYHVYYELPRSFGAFVEQNDLKDWYPNLSGPEDDFALLSTISKYDIRKSSFYKEENRQMIRDCFCFTIERLREIFRENEMNFEEAVFQPTKNMAPWTPFKDALFYPWLIQENRRVVISEKEIYICNQNRWSFNSVLTTESGRQLIGYIMKQMEASLRKAVKHKYAITASLSGVTHGAVARLEMRGVSLEREITNAVLEFHREATRTVVKVNLASLERIRQEALETQEKLIVSEEELEAVEAQTAGLPLDQLMQEHEVQEIEAAVDMGDGPAADFPAGDPSDPWAALKRALSEIQLTALRMAANGEGSLGLKRLADEQGIMLEVLMDGINELAMDYVGDSLMDEEHVIYEDYIEEVKGMVEG